ncbi:helix-turn-helix transcriptional regulator [Hymenobacter negativus]|uniref:Response regulator transcription factor n=1 Tax=Hymenobacter negativus TaxID=2795026 RepID=A0ABS3QB72_9BACT|nr:response regulator transcription factor [Hymenobacter negativus]MBO2008504.1 response regulator transcription factor [Hymenobacter negativus]
MTDSTPTALIAAAPTLWRKGLIAILKEWWPQLRIALTADATQVADLVASSRFGLLVLDEALPGRALPELLGRMYRTRPAQRLAVLTDPNSPAQLAGMPPWPGNPLRLPRHVLPHALVAALRTWLDAPIESALIAQRTNSDTMPDPFSRRELEVLRLVVADCCNEEIANRLFINVRTVETHRRNLLHKAGTRTLVGLAARAVREGWVA